MYKIISDGTNIGTKIINTETNEILKSVQRIVITLDVNTLEASCKMDIMEDMPFEICLKDSQVEINKFTPIKEDNKD